MFAKPALPVGASTSSGNATIPPPASLGLKNLAMMSGANSNLKFCKASGDKFLRSVLEIVPADFSIIKSSAASIASLNPCVLWALSLCPASLNSEPLALRLPKFLNVSVLTIPVGFVKLDFKR